MLDELGNRAQADAAKAAERTREAFAKVKARLARQETKLLRQLDEQKRSLADVLQSRRRAMTLRASQATAFADQCAALQKLGPSALLQSQARSCEEDYTRLVREWRAFSGPGLDLPVPLEFVTGLDEVSKSVTRLRAPPYPSAVVELLN